MIVSKTPLRISFFSGGSDLPSFYEREDGAALSVTIDKFIYVITHTTSYDGIKTMYDEVQIASEITDMEHIITKKTLQLYNGDNIPKITIASISDIDVKGSGLGSSSAFTVGLVNNTVMNMTKVNLAEAAFNIEAIECGFPVGKQDQYAAAFGGFNLFKFQQNGYVTRTELPLIDTINELKNRLLLVYSGKGREANKILQKQSEAVVDQNKFDLIKRNRDFAYQAYDCLKEGRLDTVGGMLHLSWMAKKKIVDTISDNYFDDIYYRAYNAGAYGGKLLGAGGGGFFIFYVPPERKQPVINTLLTETPCKVYDFNFVEEGSRIIL